jgi:hypothetical protein
MLMAKVGGGCGNQAEHRWGSEPKRAWDLPARRLAAGALGALLVVGCATARPVRPSLPPACNGENRFGAMLRADAEAGARDVVGVVGSVDETQRKKIEKILFWRMVRAVILEGENHNAGVVALRGLTFRDGDGSERPVLLFRSGFTPSPDSAGSCFSSLLAGGVRHVVNLFDGDIPVADLVADERRAAERAGATYSVADDSAGGYGPWRETLRKHYDDPEQRRVASLAVARLIRERILLPDGKPPRGHVHVHCGGGMHRTGMIVGVVERCVNREPMEVVEAHYKRHVGWKSASHPGGLEEGNLRFLRELDCALLEGTR